MTDVTELAQSLKAAAEKYKSVWGIARYSKAVEAREKFHELVTPANVIALVEALEKAQQQMTESENRVRKQNRHICELFDDNTALRQRIAGLEARTVKLPDLRQIVSGDRYVWSDGVYNYSQDVKVALAAAGIKVEAE
ncbi:TPA: hypothetical protein MCW73_001463 [Klebsiella pneumoniae]|uniref:hypothetical protein n=1 Tax=Klebsiella pneumoniae TaxID=573 RepID=UPI000C7CDA90|nr:hypothetical protein [Klebsiella pneumoniae]PLE76279.1 hypothetical protein B6I77_05625 [Klebsiella pneumoniae]PLH13829.1 hypothetical protein B6J23_23480 [Klebsiella pneumoniae]QPV93329.1 hypothetical protein I8N74_06365 [Klebsiella pneumoniae]HBT7661946.1 hypothetical protein [Klebsiella pneumoniae]